ncbi:MAG: glycosyltransferase family 4 protein [Candidatus Sabulitectum sp.]|nr:glycosyltransferase family 4 protein [Candidatus Sabulitectum sp.]
MKRIMFIHHAGTKGGSFDSLFYLLEALDQSQYEVVVCASTKCFQDAVEASFTDKGFKTCSCDLPMFRHTTGGDYNLFRKSGLQGIWCWFRHYSLAKLELKALLNTVKPDMVHFNSLTLAPYACAVKSSGIPVVVHVRESVLSGIMGVRRAWLRWHLVKYADKVIVICRANLSKLNLPDGKGTVIYNPVPLFKFDWQIAKSVARKRLGVPVGAKVVLMTVSAGARIKGYVQFIEAMKKIVITRRDLWCLTPGYIPPESPHPEINSIRRVAALTLGRYRGQKQLYELGNADILRRRMLGGAYARNIELWIAAADVVCVPYIKPHFSRTILEAGAMKKPVVASRIEGIEECVEDGKTGFLVPPGDVKRLCEALRRLLDDDLLRKSMGESNYLLTTALGDSLVSAQKIMHLYKELLSQKLNTECFKNNKGY